MAKRVTQSLTTKPAETPTKAEPYTLRGSLKTGQTKNGREAELMVEGLAMNAVVGLVFSSKLGVLDLTEAFAQILDRARETADCNTKSQESILSGQVISLNAIYTDLAIARQNISNAAVFERLMRLALKAQSNCRATAEALAEMRNPPTVFARQANFANGPQQINNESAPALPRARNSESVPNKLLEANGERLDAGTPGAASQEQSGPGDRGSK
jgi:uncharacterized protein YyaL (SSP411 family)